MHTHVWYKGKFQMLAHTHKYQNPYTHTGGVLGNCVVTPACLDYGACPLILYPVSLLSVAASLGV